MTPAQVTDRGGVRPAITCGYDDIGDITSKSDMGSYSGTSPHAVSSVAGVHPGTYAYDADGNMVNRNGTTITWNSDNLPVSITQSGSNSSSFAYAPDKHRYYQSAVIAGVTETTVYAGAFEAVTTGGVTTYRYHLSADSREVAEIDLSNSGSSVIEKISYVLSDHLGSTDVVETIDVNGNVLSTTAMSFSAWGGRREPNTWLPPVGSTETQADHSADRYGFTHQEMLDQVGIIHMNGRIYDPNLGRFLSVDPVFEFPTNTQSLNPYSYVLNNPLSMTDPTGYAACEATVTTTGSGTSTTTTTCNTTATDVDSHIAQHGQTTVTVSRDANGKVTNTSISGNGFHLGETAEVTLDNGAQRGSAIAEPHGDSSGHSPNELSPAQRGNGPLNAPAYGNTQTSGAAADAEANQVKDKVGGSLPTTNRATVTAKYDTRGGEVYIGVHMYFVEGANKQAVVVATIRDAWSGQIGKFHLNTNIVTDAGYKDGDAIVAIDPVVTRSSTQGNWMFLNPHQLSDAGHEFGHILGEQDRYTEFNFRGRIVDLPNVGAPANSIMVRPDGIVTPSDIEMVLEANPIN